MSLIELTDRENSHTMQPVLLTRASTCPEVVNELLLRESKD